MKLKIDDVLKSSNQPDLSDVELYGWIDRIRLLKNVQFLVLRDTTGKIQITNPLENDSARTLGELIAKITPESFIRVVGRKNFNPQVKLGGIEIIPEEIEILSLAETPLPLQPSAQLKERLDWRFLDLRHPQNFLIFKIQTVLEQAMREFWAERNFIEIHSPKLMGSASESGAELFEVKYFEGKAYLAQSPQFYKQMAMAAGFERIFEIGPVFRANPSFTSRHDTEFTSIDVEFSPVNSHLQVMEMEELLLKHCLTAVKEKLGEEILQVFGVEIAVPTIPFPKLTMTEAYTILAEKNHQIPKEYNGDLDPEGEKKITDYIKDKYGHEFVFVTDYPISVRPFYHMRHEDNPTLTKSFDLLWKGLEITTGAMREHRYEKLEKQAKEKGLNPESIKFYLDFFHYGMPPHGGFGLGLTRLLMILLNIKNVREVTYLYRGPNRLTP
ncbi:MAG TPA: aspartate--tRNA(Asn) ligase [Candidatus Magasanikbacteria bacterium]|nr:aspartate--tRNA(Asn) ligase [Candidatus Magasanikbacteria bacterium]